jgi:cell cycle related kinase
VKKADLALVLWETMEATDYKILEKVGEGAFGTVFRALDRATGQQVALKKIRVRDVRILPPNALRELNAMRCLDHPHVMPLLGMHTHGANLVLVMPFVPCNLASLLAERDAPLPEAHAACLSRMLLEGLHAIHHHGLLHRDLKPGNLLLDASGRLLIADFGQARLRPREHDTASLSHAVATRWYRAPELLFGARRYDIGVDIWACGCVIAQLLTLSPLLPGDSDIDQLFTVVRFLGSPTPLIWPGVESLPDYCKIELPADIAPTPLRQMLPLASDEALSLVEQMLRYDAAKRLPPLDALGHVWVCERASRVPPTPREMLPQPPPGQPFVHAGMGDGAGAAAAQRTPAAITQEGASPPNGPSAVRSRVLASMAFPAKQCTGALPQDDADEAIAAYYAQFQQQLDCSRRDPS